MEHLADINAVITHDADISGNGQPPALDFVHAADVGDIVGIEDAAGRLRQIQESGCGNSHRLGIHIDCGNQVFLPQCHPQLRTGPAEAGHPVPGDGGILTVDKGDAPVPHAVGVIHQVPDAADVVGQDTAAVVKDIVHGDHWDAAVHQIDNGVVRVIHRGDDDAVEVAVPGVLHIAELSVPQPSADEGDVVTQLCRAVLEAVENVGEEPVGQP